MLPEPETIPDEDFRDKLESIVDLLTCATEGTTYPPGRDQFPSDEKRPDPIRPVTDFSKSAKQSFIFKHDALFTAYADSARQRSYDPAFRRLADNIDDLVCNLAEKLSSEVQIQGPLENILRSRPP